MSNSDGPKQQGNRVYRIDEECYVIYLGSEGHWVRPFLRIGTSRYLPNQIKRHIGSVVITDHLTGDFFFEADCLDARSVKGTRYVGTQNLVNAVKHFVHREQIAYQALEPVETEEPPKGGQVLFFEDGNIRVFLDGHRLFDLSDRERFDRHGVYRLKRINDIVSTSRGAYRTDDLHGSGFILDSDGSVVSVGEGAAFIERATPTHSLGRWAVWGVPLDLLRGIGGETGWPALRELYKYRLTTEQQITSIPPKNDEERDAIRVFAAAGIKEERRRIPAFPSNGPLPKPGNPRANALESTPPIEFYLSDGSKWAIETAPPVLPGVLYTYEDYQSDIEFRHLLTKEIRDEVDAAGSESGATDQVLHAVATRQDISPIDRVCAALWLWNRRSVPGSGDADSDLRDLIESNFAEQHIPVVAIFRGDNDVWHLRFRLRDGITRSAITDNDRAREKIEPLLRAPNEAKLFSDERERLLAFLQELLEAHRRAEEEAKRKEAAARRAAEEAKRKEEEEHRRNADDSSSSATVSSTSTSTTQTRATKPNTAATTNAGTTNAGTTTAGTARPRREIGSDNEGRRVPIIPITLVILLVGAAAFWFFGRPPQSDIPEVAATIEQPADEAGGSAPPDDDPAVANGVDSTDSDADAEPVTDTNTGTDVNTGTDTAGANIADSTDDTVPDGDTNTGTNTGTDTNSGTDGGSVQTTSPTHVERGGDGADWTNAEILRVTNWIAVDNGYHPVGVDTDENPDPDWIFPGNTFVLPEGTTHTVARGDTLWSIAESFLTEAFLASHMELSRFRDLISKEEFPVEELEDQKEN